MQTNCLLCNRAAPTHLCSSCANQIDTCLLPTQQQLQTDSLQIQSQQNLQLQVVAWGRYQQSVRRLLTQLKYENRPEVGDFLGQQLAQTWLRHSLPRLPLVPIPLHLDRLTQRGYNQAELIAHSFAQFVGVPIMGNALTRPKATIAQYGLSWSDRQQNLDRAFNFKPGSIKPGIQILLIDDIYTTGSTIAAASQALQEAGVNVWGVAVIARS